ncbi:hypothetical protein OAS90_01280 [Candidatus Pelagibacter sp.]|nr:hypothetical protein [Candidatus Pelagibacter sp.]
MSKLAKLLIEDLQGDWSKPSLKFFRSNDAYGYVIWLTLMYSYSEKENVSIETIIKKVENYASRRTIIDFINKGVRANFIIKKNSTDDKRKIFVEPSDITIKEYEEWSNEFIKSVV